MKTWTTLAVASALTLSACGETITRSEDAGGAEPDATLPVGRDTGTRIDASLPIAVDAALPPGRDVGTTPTDDVGMPMRIDAALPPVIDAGMPVFDDAAIPDAGMITFPTSVTYIIGTVSIPNGATAARVAPGFNLDALNSGTGGGVGCVASNPDYVSLTGEVGVDNRFVGSVVGTLQSVGGINVQTTVDGQIASGTLLLAVRVNDIDSFTNDASVTLDVFLVKQASCVGATCPVVGGVMPGQAWRQRAMAYATGAPATITGGNLRGVIPTLPFNVDPVRFDIQNATLGATILPAGLANGQVGGTIAFSQLITAAMAVAPGTSEPLLRGVVQPDLNPRPAMPDVCDGVSVGYGFTAVTAASVAGL